MSAWEELRREIEALRNNAMAYTKERAGFEDGLNAVLAIVDRLAPDDGLAEAWAAAEAALPEGGRLHLQQRAGQESITLEDGQTWVARQGRDESPYEAWATDRSQSLGFAYGDSPVEVLRALATRLAATPPHLGAADGE